MDKYQYKLVGRKPEDYKEARILKTGLTAVFTINEIESSERSVEKRLKEVRGQLELERAKMANVERNHPFVLKMSEEDLFTAHLYMEAKAMVKGLEPEQTNLQTALTESAKEKDDIMRALGFEPSLTSSSVDIMSDNKKDNEEGGHFAKV